MTNNTESTGPACPACSGTLSIKRSCTRVYFSCKSCGKNFPLEKHIELMDDRFEEQLANVQCNRL